MSTRRSGSSQPALAGVGEGHLIEPGVPSAPSPPGPSGTRERLIAAMADALQRRGLHGVGVAEVLARAGAPKGVLYHHFPGGKSELAVAAIHATVARLGAALDRLAAAASDPADALRTWLADAAARLERSGFEQGCPLATVALETTAEDVEIRSALAQAFATVRGRLAAVLSVAGLPPARAQPVAALVVAAYEGALMQARVAGDTRPMTDTAHALVRLLRSELDNERP